MKIYKKPESILLIRIAITTRGSEKKIRPIEKITLYDTTFQECCDMIERIISANENIVQTPDQTVVTIREGKGSWNGGSKSFKTNLLEPDQLKEFITNEVTFNH